MTGNVRQQRQQQTRERLITAATQIIAERGFAEASVPEIAKAADLSTGAIYSNFSGKEELFLAAMTDLMGRGAQRRQAIVADGGAPDELLARMLQDWVATVEDDPDAILMLAEFWLYAIRRVNYRPLVGSILAAIRVNFVETIQAHLGDVDDQRAQELAAAIQALAYGHAMQQLSDPDAVPSRQFVQSVTWLLEGAGVEMRGWNES